jgi:holin-like protein
MMITKIITQIGLLYIIYILGVWIQETLHLIIPGSIIGMMILFILLSTKAIKSDWIKEGSRFLIKHMALLFLPVTVGIISFLDLFIGNGFLIIVTVLVSTFLVMACTGIVSQQLENRKVQEHE